jgi:hypothetical protein
VDLERKVRTSEKKLRISIKSKQKMPCVLMTQRLIVFKIMNEIEEGFYYNFDLCFITCSKESH